MKASLFAIVSLIVLEVSFTSAYSYQVEGITTSPDEFYDSYVEAVTRNIILSEASLRASYETKVESPTAFRFYISGKEYYLVITGIYDDSLSFVLTGEGKEFLNTVLEDDNKLILRINQDNFEFEIKSFVNRIAEVRLLLYKILAEDITVPGEEFDVDLELVDNVIYNSYELTALINYIFFKVNSSAINTRIISSIYDSDGREVYTDVDEMIIETQGSFVKRFDKLNLPNGDYVLRAQVYYGETKDADAQESFSVVGVPAFKLMGQAILFFMVVFGAFVFVRWKTKKT